MTESRNTNGASRPTLDELVVLAAQRCHIVFAEVCSECHGFYIDLAAHQKRAHQVSGAMAGGRLSPKPIAPQAVGPGIQLTETQAPEGVASDFQPVQQRDFKSS